MRKRQLSRKRNQRQALLKIMAGNLILNERIKTTKAKAKEVAPFVAKAIGKAKKQDLAGRKALVSMISKKAAFKAFSELGPRYSKRKGGYTRIIKLGPRLLDGAEMVLLELVKENTLNEKSNS